MMDINKITSCKLPNSTTLKDSDGDGVTNVLDCKPYNPKKQGFIHDIIQKFKADREVKREVRDKIETGEIRKEEDIEKTYTHGGVGGSYAKHLLRKQELKQAYEDSYHQARIERQKKLAKERANPTFKPVHFNNFLLGTPNSKKKQNSIYDIKI